jgi:hypothetical protein
MWCIPPKSDAEFVCAMENVLEVYKRPYDPDHPVVCFDEKSKQLVGEIATPIPAAPGRVECHDYEYVRNGTANLFMLVEPLHGWRHVTVTSRRTKLDFAAQVKELVDVHYPQAEKITLVMDNLNTHRMSCLYDAFTPQEARRIIEKIEVVHTPKHGSWLNMAECELSVLEKQCLGERIGGGSFTGCCHGTRGLYRDSDTTFSRRPAGGFSIPVIGERSIRPIPPRISPSEAISASTKANGTKVFRWS